MAGCLWKKPKVLVPLVLVVAVACVVVVVLARRGSNAYTPPPLAFDGKSDDLKQTVIVPTLDTPMPEGKNVIWCASFQLAWNEFRDDVIGEPVKIDGAQNIVDRLNASRITGDVLETDDYYAKAGFVGEGIIGQIQTDMAARFPNVPTPQFDVEDPQLVAVAYGYVQVSILFSPMFHENRREFLFRGVPVTSFGVRPEDGGDRDPAGAQVRVLYSSQDEDEDEDKPWSDENEFILDLSLRTEPYEVILARLKPRATLAEAVADLERKLRTETHYFSHKLERQDVLLVPNLHWRVGHHFREIEGEDKRLQNQGHVGNWLDTAWQMIEFKLDRAGAVLKSEAKIEEKTGIVGPRRFVFDKPFLILMRRREEGKHPSDYTTEPFFVMWVDNAELLCKQ